MSEVEKGTSEPRDIVMVGLYMAHPLELTQGRVQLEDGKMYLIPSHRPVTLKGHTIEIQAEEERERLKMIFNHTTSAIMALYDAATAHFITGSSSYCEIVMAVHGVPAEQLPAYTWHQIALVGQEEPQLWQIALETRKPIRRSEVHVICHPSGEERVWDYSLIPVKDEVELDQIRFMLVSAVDITEPVRMRKEVERLNEIKDEFIALASHELKTPVTTIKSLTHVLQRKYMQQAMQEPVSMLRVINQQIDRLTKLIDDLLNVSTIQAGHLDYEEAPVDIDFLVHETVALLQTSTPTHVLNVSGATQATILGDADRLRQVLFNLIANAVKYSPQAHSVDILLTSTQQSVQIAIRDYGIGIPKAAQQHLFERFYRVRGEQEQTFPGLGMGLYIVHEIIKRHRGTLTLESEEGKGSTFLISLPLQEALPHIPALT